MAARGSDLPGATTARMLERMIEGYEGAFAPDKLGQTQDAADTMPSTVRRVMRAAAGRSWKHFADEPYFAVQCTHMSDEDKVNLRPASAQDIQESLSFALRYAGRKRVHHADDAMARITAERLVQHLERSGFVLMNKPDRAAPTTRGHGHPNNVG